MLTNPEEQARELLTEAKKTLSRGGFFKSLFTSNTRRTEDAIESYQKAGNLFKLAKNFAEAEAAFNTAANLNLSENNKSEAANDFIQAAKCSEKYDSHNAIKLYLQAIEIYLDLGRFVTAAKLHNKIAEIYENGLEIQEAIQHYEQAADYYKIEENFISAKKCLLKVAEYAAGEFKDYNKAIGIYQEIGFFDLKSPILQYNAKESFFKAVLCHLCVDSLNARYALNSYLTKYPDFENTRQYKFLSALIESVEDADTDSFTKIVRDYDSISYFDSWYTKILLEIKKQIKDEPDLL